MDLCKRRSMEKKTKLRALCLLKILYERTDKNHPLSTAELIELMKEEYYVAGYSDQHKAIWSFRVDRIYKQAKILKEDAVPRPDSFDEDRYVRTKFRMNSKEPETVELICANETMDAIIDQFGEEVKTYAYSLSSFRAEVEVTTSQMFFSWIFGLGGRVMINGPQRVKDEYEKMVRDAAANLSHQLCERLK